MNHMREGSTAGISLSASAALCRISSAKSATQVRCRACQEILSCPLALREHCESRAHSVRIAQLTSMSSEAGNVPGGSSVPAAAAISMSPSPETVLECRHCPFETTDTAGAIEHMQQHPPNVEGSGTEQESLSLESGCGKCILHYSNSRDREIELGQQRIQSSSIIYPASDDFF
uniref:C2H2-type domain-containing protein n=1 Tax=Elaeophora elaphi TaxID=1147741 RepID=A0A0R3RRJ9_9BILA